MKTIKITIGILTAAVALATASCGKSEILTPSGERYIYMSYPEKGNQTFNFSFISTPDESARIAVPIKFAGRKLTEDLPFALQIDSKSTLLQGTEYEFSEQVFHEGNFLDTIFVTVHKTARMENETFSLKFTLTTNANFQASNTGALEAELYITAKIAQPDWWTQDVTDYFLGTYSDKKFTFFSQQIFVGDFGKLDDSEKRYYALKFKYWLQQNPQTEDDDDSQMKVAIQG